MNAPTLPAKTREQLIADERAAEKTVVDADLAYRLSEVDGDPDDMAAKKADLDAKRTASLAVRKAMTDGLAEWTRYLHYQEVARHAAEVGADLPGVTPPPGAIE